MERKKNRKPTHPGEILRYHYLIPLKISIPDMAEYLNITDSEMLDFLNGKKHITEKFALLLSEKFNTNSELWLNLQKEYDSFVKELNKK